MSATNDPTNYYRSPIVAGLKSAILATEKILPKATYRALYSAAFDSYRTLLRILYARKLWSAKLTGNSAVVSRDASVLNVMPYSLVGSSGLEVTYDVVAEVSRKQIAGDIVECGVAQGGSAALMILSAKQNSQQKREFWLFDSYEGLPDPTEEDYDDKGKTGHHVRPLPKGSCLGTVEQVSELLFERMGFATDNIHLVKGWFQDTLPVTTSKIGQIAVLRLDGDWYESTKVCLEHLYDKVAAGGILIIDDYASCYGSQRAVDEFLAARGKHANMLSDGRGGVYFVKPS